MNECLFKGTECLFLNRDTGKLKHVAKRLEGIEYGRLEYVAKGWWIK